MSILIATKVLRDERDTHVSHSGTRSSCLLISYFLISRFFTCSVLPHLQKFKLNRAIPLLASSHIPWRLTYLFYHYRFGGTDGRHHYNDTWVLDTNTHAWANVSCTGLIPSPREGHAAALVGDIMYVFGGRGLHNNDLGDLVALRITSKLISLQFRLLDLVWRNMPHHSMCG